jgi:hypothetical protein
MNIFDRLKNRINNLRLLINSNKTDEINLRINVNKKYINSLFITINNLNQYKVGKKVTQSKFLLDLEMDNFKFFMTPKYDRNNAIIDSELLENKYFAPPGKFSGCEKEIIDINTKNNTALIKYNTKKSTSGTFAYSPDTWINLEYLEVV